MRPAAFIVLFETLIGLLLFGAAGRIDLPWVWALLGIHATAMVIMVAAMDPDLRRERLVRKRDGGCDRRLRALITVCILVHLVLAGLDVRWGWSPAFPFWVHALALIIYSAAIAFAIRAMIVNRFFAPAVRIQSERGHETVTAGPYRFVRHPATPGCCSPSSPRVSSSVRCGRWCRPRRWRASSRGARRERTACFAHNSPAMPTTPAACGIASCRPFGSGRRSLSERRRRRTARV